ncbi:hypothetical protein H6G81_14600 [Scytonema hofmannii FACHB-248]|uniref:Uncharacterized protein n=1 Tax=Scytonema hofmannii FACHB-248 TaxID=1842502 RepID=A0ABR8GR84_9CYAN|nr:MULTISPECIES: hypothetical protein [Nostocales]MBD2605722.1 hypothetical protein [Scytonema hofmannii FACHB-248]
MTRSIQHSEENRVRSYPALRLSVRSLFLATAIITGIAYLDCNYLRANFSKHILSPDG